jgi:hypothetical protein
MAVALQEEDNDGDGRWWQRIRGVHRHIHISLILRWWLIFWIFCDVRKVLFYIQLNFLLF